MPAPKRCQSGDCMNRYPCSKHPQGWNSSKSPPLPRDWAKLVKTVKRRSKGMCEFPGCKNFGSSVDHIIPRAEGGSHSITNLRYLCDTHHVNKTQAESKRGLKRRYQK